MHLFTFNFKKDCHKKIFESVLFVCITVLAAGGSLFLMTAVIPPQFQESYQNVIVRQYDRYRSLGSGKIVLMGTSALAFGCDMDLLEELTGRPCQILGNHAGMATPYFMELSKSNLCENDIVIIQYSNYHAQDLGTDLLLTGMDGRFDMYRYFRPMDWDDVLMDYHNYAIKKFSYWARGGYHASGQYSASAFDENGNMVIERLGCLEPSPLGRKPATLDFDFHLDYIDYLNEYVAYCHDRGAEVYFTVSPVLDEYVELTEQQCLKWDERLSSLLQGRLISHRFEYVYPRKYMYGLEHCNTEGAQKRTLQLYHDLKNRLDREGRPVELPEQEKSKNV